MSFSSQADRLWSFLPDLRRILTIASIYKKWSTAEFTGAVDSFLNFNNPLHAIFSLWRSVSIVDVVAETGSDIWQSEIRSLWL